MKYLDLDLRLNQEGRLHVILKPFYKDSKNAAIDLIESGRMEIEKLKDPF